MCSKKWATGKARRIVDAADLEPDHLRDDGRAAIGDDDHLHAVLERELKYLRPARRGGTGDER
jgi:hypothetical protein